MRCWTHATLKANVSGGTGSHFNTVVDKGGDTLEAKLKFTGKAKDVLGSGAIGAALRGDFSRAHSALARVTQLEATLTPIKMESTELSYKAGDGVDAIGGSFSATTVDRQEPLFEYKGTVKKATDQLAQALKQQRYGFIRG